jgi:serine/threonine protein kinase
MDQLKLFVDLVLHNRYKITGQLGRGGMGAVYQALDQDHDRTVAIKQMLPADPELRRAFRREATILSQITHPGLPHAIDYFENENGLFLAMGFIEGQNLGQLLASRATPFAPHQVKVCAQDLLQTLNFLHTQTPCVIHRDIKPANLKLTPQGKIVLLDFGLAKNVKDNDDLITNICILAYTPNYAPLEQIQGESTHTYSDIYALGATLYHLLTGVPPTDALKRANHILCKRRDPLPTINQLVQGVPRSLSSLVMKALSLSPSDRPASASQMLQQLQAGIIAPAFRNPSTVFTQPQPSQPQPVLAQLEATNGLPIGTFTTSVNSSPKKVSHLTVVPRSPGTNSPQRTHISIPFPEQPVHLNPSWLTSLPLASTNSFSEIQHLRSANRQLYRSNEHLLRYARTASTLLVLICTAIVVTYFYQSELNPLRQNPAYSTSDLSIESRDKKAQRQQPRRPTQTSAIFVEEPIEETPEVTIEELIQQQLLKQQLLKLKNSRKTNLKSWNHPQPPSNQTPSRLPGKPHQPPARENHTATRISAPVRSRTPFAGGKRLKALLQHVDRSNSTSLSKPRQTNSSGR